MTKYTNQLQENNQDYFIQLHYRKTTQINLCTNRPK